VDQAKSQKDHRDRLLWQTGSARLVDSHTHLVFVSPRLVDFEKRSAGASYEEIAAAGGGIRSSLEAVRRASKAALAMKVASSLEQMAAHGTTTVEAKSGYGLTVDSELKSLEAIREAASGWSGTVVATLLGAHVVPKEFQGCSQKYIEIVCKEMIPRVARRKLAQFVDVFCDKGRLPRKRLGRFLQPQKNTDWVPRAHGPAFGTVLRPFLRFNPASFDHMDHVSEDDIPQLAKNDTVATLVPGANYFLGLNEYPNARRLIDAGVPVALATDYNPAPRRP